MISLDQYPDGGTIVHIDPPPKLAGPPEPEARVVALIPKLLAIVEKQPGLTQRGVVPLIGGRADAARAALEMAVRDGHIRCETGARNSIRYFPVNGSA